MDERGRIFRVKKYDQKGGNIAKEMRSYILVSHVINGGTLLNYLGGVDVSYHSDTPFEELDDGYTTECRLGLIFFTWCMLKLYFCVTLCIACHIIIVFNDISHTGIKVISWR